MLWKPGLIIMNINWIKNGCFKRWYGARKQGGLSLKGRVLTFDIAGQLYGIDITSVKEINRRLRVTAVPDAPDYIVGLMNMRGQIVTVLDLAKKMLAGSGLHSSPSACVILKNLPGELDYIGFAIDRPGDVIEADDSNCEPSPAYMEGRHARFVKEVVKLKQELILVIEPSAIFDYQ